MSNGPGHNTNPWKHFDVLRCVECDGIIKVPKTALEFKCIHCDTLNVFEMEYSDDAEDVQTD